MAKPLRRRDAQAFKKRWALVAEAERIDLLSTSMATKLAQLGALMASARALHWETSTVEETEAVRARWVRLARLAREQRGRQA